MNLLKSFSARINKTALLSAVLFLAAVVPFLPALKGEFLGFDDQLYIATNPRVTQELSPASVKAIFTSKDVDLYTPITTLSFAVEHNLYGEWAAGYHAVNIILHAFNALLIFWLFSLLGGTATGFLTALIFAVHPQRPESVAWIAERKDVLYSFFALASFIAYIKWRELARTRLYWLSAGLFLLSLLAKPAAVALPLVLMCADWYQHRPITIKDKLPYIIMAAGFSVLALVWQAPAPEIYHLKDDYGIFFRLILAGHSVWFYALKTFVPYGLSPIYPYTDGLNLVFPGAVMGAVFIAAALWFGRKNRTLLFSAVCYLLMLAPVSGIVPFNDTFAGDRYSYMTQPWLLFAAVCAGLSVLHKHQQFKRLAAIAFSGLVLLFAAASATRCNYWTNTLTFWTEVIERYPTYHVALYSRGTRYATLGITKPAMRDYEAAIKAAPDDPGAYLNRGALKAQLGEMDAALKDFDKALELDPVLVPARLNRARLYAFTGRPVQALDDLVQNCYYPISERRSDIAEQVRRQLDEGHYKSPCLYDKLVFVMIKSGLEKESQAYASKIEGCSISAITKPAR